MSETQGLSLIDAVSGNELAELDREQLIVITLIDGELKLEKFDTDQPRSPGVLAEVVADGPELGLLVVSEGGTSELRKGGHPALPVEMFQKDDVMRLAGHGVVVAVCQNQHWKVAEANLTCVVCAGVITAGETAVQCAKCGANYHDQPDSIPEADRLNCVRLVERCTNCNHALEIER